MNPNSYNAKTFITSDIFLTSYLRIRGCQLLRIDRKDQRRVKFVFSEDAEDEALKYFNGAKVEACRLASAVSESKNLLFDVG